MSEWLGEIEGLPEELAENETLGQYKSLPDALKGLVETKAHVGNSIRIPGPEAGEEDRKAFLEKLTKNAPELMFRPDLSEKEQADEFFTTLGRPSEAKGYENPEWPEGFEGFDDEAEKALREFALESNFTQDQYKALITKVAQEQVAGKQGMTQAQEEAQRELKRKWGMAYDERMALVEKVKDTFFQDLGPLNNSAIEGLYEVAKALGGENSQVIKQPEKSPTMTPDEAKARISEIRNNPDFLDKSKPERQKELMNQLVKLQRLAHPDKYAKAS